MKLGTVLECNHAIHDVLLEDFVRVAADLLETLSCLVLFLVLMLVVDTRLPIIIFEQLTVIYVFVLRVHNAI